MNLTELARILKITPNDLKDKLPELGFNIGFRAIKVDNHVAKKIIAAWPAFMRKVEREERWKKRDALASRIEDGEKRQVKVGKYIVVRDFATASGLPINKILAELMKNGIFTSMNEKIDFDTASVIGADMGLEVLAEEEQKDVMIDNSHKIKDVMTEEASLEVRSPVIVVMGHVDHGKTKLLDAIRHTNVVAGEAGGITQHIGAYQVERKGRKLTFIDTPGHEAFTAMRNRGAKVADIAILVVAADDGVMPQTTEAYRIIQAAGIPFIVAINKIDKPDANIDKVKQELSSKLDILPEDWGGKTVCLPISAKDRIGIDEILDTLILVADMEEENLHANPAGKTMGTIIESNMDKSEGIVATLLVQNGTLRIGDELCSNGIDYGKARNMKNHLGVTLLEAGPSTPVKIIGFKIQPEVGDIIEVGRGEKIKMKRVSRPMVEAASQTAEEVATDDAAARIVLLLKGDTLGSVEAIENSFNKIDTQGVKIKIIHKGLGNISEGDIARAESNGAKVIGFNIKPNPKAVQIAREKNVTIKTYKVIYELLNDIRAEIQELVKPEIVRVDLGKIKVLAIFRSEKKSQILGGKVISGIIQPNTIVELVRQGEIIDEGKISSVKSGKEDVDMIENGGECGFKLESRTPAEKDDILNIYREDKIYKKIK
ncbi:MAG: translation initiation factor IF-2 [Candidatus Falkowbacteria bacterium]